MDFNFGSILDRFTVKTVSLSKALILFYLLILNNYTTNLIGGQFREFISENRTAQHVISCLTLLVVLNITVEPNLINSIGYALGLYMWFILTTKLDLKWNLAIVGLLLLGYINESLLKQEEDRIDDDENVPEEIGYFMKKRHNKIRNIVAFGIVLSTLVGTYQYYNKKTVQYGGNFDAIKFLMSDCKNHAKC